MSDAAPISVVIPTLEAAATLPATLEALAPGRIGGLIAEVIVVDGGSQDATAALAAGAGARVLEAPRGRGLQMAAGAAAARAPWLWFVHADSRPEPGWPGAVRRFLRGGPGRAGYMDLAFDSERAAARAVATWANLRAHAGLPYGDQGLLIHRALLARIGGVPEVPLMEDVMLARALVWRRLAPIGHVMRTSAARYEAEGWLRRGARNLAVLARFALGADPADLVRRYEGRRAQAPRN